MIEEHARAAPHIGERSIRKCVFVPSGGLTQTEWFSALQSKKVKHRRPLDEDDDEDDDGEEPSGPK